MNDRPFLPTRLYVAAGLVLTVGTLGVVGYMIIEGWTWFEALYMTITTLTTVGGGEAHALSTAGKAFTVVLMVVGVGTVTYTVLALVSFVIEGQLREAVGTRWRQRKVRLLQNHFILCGFGRVGREIAREFAQQSEHFVVVDIDQSAVNDVASLGYLGVTGNAANAEVLKSAGLETARGLITALDSDADNIYVALTARVLRPNLFIVARANDADAEPKLRLAGADRIISPYTIGGRRMAHLAMRPTAVDFVDTVLSVGSSELLLEALTIHEDSNKVGAPVADLWSISNDTIVLAIKREERMIFRPGAETILRAGDEVVAAGKPDAVRDLEAMLKGAGSHPGAR